MRKYILFFLTFSSHIFINNSKVEYLVKNLEPIKFEVNSVKLNQKEIIDDTLVYIKRGGIHSATWYNPHGSRTASGLKFHKDSLTAAYNFTKMNTLLRVTNISNNQSVTIKVTDRMGYKGSNHIDLSKAAFDSIGNPKSGRIKVIVEEIVIK